MAKVSELKERARALEVQGDLAKARAIYQHILKHLEGTPALRAELPLYVKVGDLILEDGDPAGAVAMYERAAEHYALAGSARSIRALVEKIRRADPTRDDVAIALGRALLGHGHAGAAAEVILRYAHRVEREDVVAVLERVEPEARDDRATTAVASALYVLEHPPAAPQPPAQPESRPVRAGQPAVEAPARPAVAPPPPPPAPVAPPVSHAPPEESPDWEPEKREEGEEEAPAETIGETTGEVRIEMPLLSLDAIQPAGMPESGAAPPPDELEIRHGVEPPSAAPEPPAPEPPAPPEPPRAVEPPEPAPPAPRVPERPPAAKTPRERPEPEAPARPAPEADVRPPRVEPEVPVEEPAPVLLRGAEPDQQAGQGRPRQRARVWSKAEPDILVRERRESPHEKRERRGRRRGVLIITGSLLVVLVGAAAALWYYGVLPFGPKRNAGGPGSDQAPVFATDSGVSRGDASVAVDSLATPADTMTFGPIGFNAVDTTRARVAAAPADSSTLPGGRADSAAPEQPIAPPPETEPALPPVVVPPGHAVLGEIVAVRGLEVLSVAETSGGMRVIQRVPDGAELVITATVIDPEATTPGVRDIVVDASEGFAMGTARLRQYRVEARGPVSGAFLRNLLGQLVRARPVN